MSRRFLTIVTCEHGGNRIPRAFARSFHGAERVLATHRGYDIGAAPVAARMARALGAPLFVASTSRLLVDLDRSASHPRLYSEWTRPLPAEERATIFEQYYVPHRSAVERAVLAAQRGGACVVHLGIHSFTPVLDGVARSAEVGLLYDPKRRLERSLCERWAELLGAERPVPGVRRNYPYRGTSDGFTRALRREHPATRYVGVEVELNQAVVGRSRGGEGVANALVRSFREALAGLIAARS